MGRSNLVLQGLSKAGQSLKSHYSGSFSMYLPCSQLYRASEILKPTSVATETCCLGPSSGCETIKEIQSSNSKLPAASHSLLYISSANPSVSLNLSEVSKGQLEANKHFLAGVEDKQTSKC